MGRRDDDRPTIDLGPAARKAEIPAREGSQSDGVDHAAADVDAEATVAPRSHGAGRELAPIAMHGRDKRGTGPVDSIHGQPTQQIASRGVETNASRVATRYSTTTSPSEAMKFEEIERMRVFLLMSVLLSIGAAGSVALLDGDPLAFRVVMAGCVLVCVGAGLLYHIIRDPARYTVGKLSFAATIVAISSYGGVYYWGLASPAVAMILYGIYFFSLGLDVRVRLLQYAVCAFLHFAMSAAIISGVIKDRSILPIGHLSVQAQIVVCLGVQALYLITFVTARFSRKVTIDALSRLELAVRSVAQREAMLAEVRAELDRAIKVGGPGRYSEQVVGSFRLGMLIGRGGMGEVYEAHSLTDKREAAVKLLGPGTLGEDHHLRRFLREAEHAARLDSPHVVRIVEVGATAGELPFIAMERLRGTDLAHQLRRQRRLPTEQVTTLVSQLAIGLEAARLANIVHRDLKPQNVFLAEERDGNKRWKILDFGVSKSGGTGTLTRGNIVGTPAYMSPEQAKGGDVDHRADVYSLAAIVYRSVTGHPAFTGKDVPTTLYDVVYRVPTQPSILAQLPTDVDRVLALGLAKNPDDRLATALEFGTWFSAAVSAGLSYDQKRRADAYIDKHPWGTRPLAQLED
ncbi:MAG: serine/threonine protein kinase [Kofleriaceae bacterium]|nr:serine/threonine protein kinase [Kofleriaceae bacterium]